MATTGVEYEIILNAASLKPTARTLARSVELAEELVQETIYRAMRNKHTLENESNIKGWLYVIMRNIFIDYEHGLEKMKNASEKLNLQNSVVFSGDFDGIARLNTNEIMAAIHNLPQVLSAPFLLYFEGFKYIEIAKMLEVPIGTIKFRIHFCRKLLQKRIDAF